MVSDREKDPIKFLSVIASGLLTPLGDSPKRVLAAINAEVSAYGGSTYCNRWSHPMTVAQIPEVALAPLTPEVKALNLASRKLRLYRLAVPALRQVLDFPDAPNIPLFLAGPEVLPNQAAPIMGDLVALIAQHSGLPIDISMSRYFASGRAGVLQTLQLAFQFFEQTSHNYALIGGVDSFVDPATLAFLDAENRVLAEDVIDGFAPSEGAGFMVLARPSKHNDQRVKLYRPGISSEPGHKYGTAPNLGAGLSGAIAAAIQSGSGGKVGAVISSMNGESYFAKEFGVSMVRHSRHFSTQWHHHHPADCVGDLGAAFGMLGLCLGASKAAAMPESQVLVYGASDTGLRSAVCISV